MMLQFLDGAEYGDGRDADDNDSNTADIMEFDCESRLEGCPDSSLHKRVASRVHRVSTTKGWRQSSRLR